ncbi:MAG: hypothetical protein R3B07_17335 [Polyangiaceae bacterium]
MSRKSLVLNPPLWIERGTRSDPQFANLAAFELLSALREQAHQEADHDVCWLDAFTQPGSGLVWNGDVGVLGGGVQALLARVPQAIETAWVVCAESSHHAEPDLLALIAGLKSQGVANIHLVLGSGERCAEALRAQVTRVVQFDEALKEAGGRVVPRWDATDLEALGAFHVRVAKGLGWPPPNGLVLPVRLVDPAKELARMGQLAHAQSLYLLDFDVFDAAQRVQAEALAEACFADGPELIVRFDLGVPGQSAIKANELLGVAMDLWDRFRAYPDASFNEAGSDEMPASLVADFKWTFDRRLSASSGPEKVIMNLTYACNNHCTFCAVGTRTQLHGHTASQREHLLEYRKRGVTMVDFDDVEGRHCGPARHPALRQGAGLRHQRHHQRSPRVLRRFRTETRQLRVRRSSSRCTERTRSHVTKVESPRPSSRPLVASRTASSTRRPAVKARHERDSPRATRRSSTSSAELAWDSLRWINIQFSPRPEPPR